MITSNQVNDILLDVYLMYTNVELFAKYATLSVHYHLLKWQFYQNIKLKQNTWLSNLLINVFIENTRAGCS